ncbi:MAG: hypothetical protein MUC63_00975, partial [Planctomycetes bacterium]|nr:hypothetical protein [Planctomycetota bacterium]
MGLTLPAALLLHDWLLLRPRPEGPGRRLAAALLPAAPFFAFALLWVPWVVLPTASMNLMRGWHGGGWGATALAAVSALGAYAVESFVPARLQACVDFPLSRPPHLAAAASALLLGTALAFALAALRRSVWGKDDPPPGRRLAAFAVLFFLAALSPVSSLLFPIAILYAERYLYLPLLAGTLLLAAAFAKAWGPGIAPSARRLPLRPAAAVLGLALLLGVWGGKAFDHCRSWATPETLWRDVLAKT